MAPETKGKEKTAQEVQLDSIAKDMAVTCKTLDMMRKDYNKIIYALIAIVAANLGLKFISTPWYIDVAVYLCTFSGAFVLCQLIMVWNELRLANQVMRILTIAVLLTSSVTQMIIYHPGEEASPGWFPITINILLTLLAVSMVWSVWKTPVPRPKKSSCSTDKEKVE